MSTMEIWQIES